ncbi:MAG: replication initiator protein A [Lachnospiraceae bacterium]|nr:replication initiator protein A [Lachnospiraceae bacterium]
MAEREGRKTEAFDYYYGKEAEQFSFFRIPRIIIKDRRFAGLSSDAKLLYGLLLDRMALSKSNGWTDGENRVYVIYTIKEIQNDLGCGKDKAVKTMAELDSVKGIGLVEKKRRGLGLPDILYVKNFITESPMNLGGDEKSSFKSSGKPKSGVLKSRIQEAGNAEGRNTECPASGSRRNRTAAVGISEPNYNEGNNTDRGQNESIHQPSVQNGVLGKDERWMDAEQTLRLIRLNIDYGMHMESDSEDGRRLFGELYRVIADTVRGHPVQVRIGDAVFPYETVRSRFLELTGEHMEYVRDRISENTGEIRNIRGYMLAALYNAPATMGTYYRQQVRHDMYGGGWEEDGIV